MWSTFCRPTFNWWSRRGGPDRDAPSGANDLTDGHVVELGTFARPPQEERATRELPDVEHVLRKKQTLTKDRRQEIGVLAGAHRAQQNDVLIRLKTPRQVERGLLERKNGARRTLRALGIPLEIGGDDASIGGDEAIRHGDDIYALMLLAWLGECPGVLELASKVEAAEKAEHIPQRNAFLA